MYARLLALVCLLLGSDTVVRSEPPIVEKGGVVVYLGADRSTSPAALAVMKRELGALMRPAGFRLEWRDLGSQRREIESAELIVFRLRGGCSARIGGRPDPAVDGPLASSAIVDGRVLPFGWLDCEALSRFLAPALERESAGKRDYLYGRAMARVVAHELYHMVAKTREHAHAGVAKPRVTVSDLMSERFEFERTALTRIRRPAEADDADDEAVPER